jgi:flagellar biosynthetic protein FliP
MTPRKDRAGEETLERARDGTGCLWPFHIEPTDMTATAPTSTVQRSRFRRLLVVTVVALAAVFAFAAIAHAAPGDPATPVKAAAANPGGVNITLNNGKGTDVSTGVQLMVLLTLLALAPSILIMTTGFTRILIVLGFVRNALGTPQMPPNQVLIGISIFLTVFVMYPTFNAVNENALKPYQAKTITQKQAIDEAQKPIRKFMFTQVHQSDLALFVKLSKMERPKTRADVPTHVLIPAFLISELKTAFQIGFLIYIPFLIIDMVVASTLMSMGMIMLPPVMISLPFKILLFVLVDGWHLTIESLVGSFFT